MSGPAPIAHWVSLVLVIGALLLQVTLLPSVTPSGVRPDLILVVILGIGVFNGIGWDTFAVALLGGMMLDFLSGHLIGLNIMIYLLSVTAAFRVLDMFTRANAAIFVVMSASFALLAELIRALAVFLSGAHLGPIPVVLLIATTAAAYTGVVAVLVYFIMGRYISSQEPQWGWERGARR